MVAEKNCTIKSVVIDALEREFSKWELDKHREWLSKASQEDIEEYYRKRGPVRVIQFELDEPNNAVRVIEFDIGGTQECSSAAGRLLTVLAGRLLTVTSDHLWSEL